MVAELLDHILFFGAVGPFEFEWSKDCETGLRVQMCQRPGGSSIIAECRIIAQTSYGAEPDTSTFATKHLGKLLCGVLGAFLNRYACRNCPRWSINSVRVFHLVAWELEKIHHDSFVSQTLILAGWKRSCVVQRAFKPPASTICSVLASCMDGRYDSSGQVVPNHIRGLAPVFLRSWNFLSFSPSSAIPLSVGITLSTYSLMLFSTLFGVRCACGGLLDTSLSPICGTFLARSS
jgi:hypothetical protein